MYNKYIVQILYKVRGKDMKEKHLQVLKKTTEEMSDRINRLHKEFAEGKISLQQLKDGERLQHILFNNIKNRIAIEQQFIA